MALVLSARLGFDVYLNDRRVVVSKIHSSTAFVLRLWDGRHVDVNEYGWTEVGEGIRFTAGIPRSQSTKLVQMKIEAPHEFLILRGELYRKANPDKGAM